MRPATAPAGAPPSPPPATPGPPRAAAAAAAPAPAETARPRDGDDVLRSAQLRVPAGRDGGEMRFDVTPDGLGRVQVHVVVREDAVHAALYAQQGDARDALTAQRPSLEAALGRSQLRLEGFTVGLGQPQQETAHERSPGHPSPGGPAPLAPAPVPQPAAAEPLAGRGGLSLRA
ncbi:MAG TPA: flagellar hook-length control protein FliK [Candidatus Binatia bacterium]|nr:flagellar hook-length control protein FliK [Candidatus Binatia bacterium]